MSAVAKSEEPLKLYFIAHQPFEWKTATSSEKPSLSKSPTTGFAVPSPKQIHLSAVAKSEEPPKLYFIAHQPFEWKTATSSKEPSLSKSPTTGFAVPSPKLIHLSAVAKSEELLKLYFIAHQPFEWKTATSDPAAAPVNVPVVPTSVSAAGDEWGVMVMISATVSVTLMVATPCTTVVAVVGATAEPLTVSHTCVELSFTRMSPYSFCTCTVTTISSVYAVELGSSATTLAT